MQVSYEGGNRFRLKVREHEVRVGQPEEGSDVGPTPVELFVGAVASCAAYYAKAYFTKHGLDAAGLRVEVDFDMADHPRRIAAISARVVIPAHVGEEHYAGIEALAKACLLDNTLKNAVELPLCVVREGDEELSGVVECL